MWITLNEKKFEVIKDLKTSKIKTSKVISFKLLSRIRLKTYLCKGPKRKEVNEDDKSRMRAKTKTNFHDL